MDKWAVTLSFFLFFFSVTLLKIINDNYAIIKIVY